jgi:hypothetical protein
MKKKGSKKKKNNSVHSSKKVKRFFFFNNKVAPMVFIAGVLVFALFLFFFNSSTGGVISGNAITLTTSPPQFILTITDFLNLGAIWKDILISLIVLVILYAGLYDILELTSIFSNPWVMHIIAGGLALIACLTSLVYTIVTFALQVASSIGAFGIAIEVIMAVVVFIGLSFGSSKIALWAAKRKAQQAMIKTSVAAGDVAAGIRGMRTIEKEFKKKE